MHFSIPDTQELNEGNGSTFIGYNIHINGVFHCTVRYKQLHNLNEQLKKEFGNDSIPPFPPKKLLPLTASQLEERRALLEKYIQTLGQDSKLVSSELIIGFLLSAQQETTCERKQEVNLDVYTMNNYHIPVRVSTFDRTEQTVTEIEKGWVIASREVKSQLTNLQVSLAKREYIELAQKLKYYGFVQFMPCYCDYPKPQTKVLIAVGDQELSLRIIGPGHMVKEGNFKVTRMRCWRITATHNKQEIAANSRSSSSSGLELSFEYLMSKDKLQWITISSEQAILISVCLQSLVDELLMKKNGMRKKPPSVIKGSWSYMKRDGSSHLISIDDVDLENKEDLQEPKFQESFSIKKLQEKFSSVSFKSGREFIENHAFEGIGDDDL
ncbi:hypothetical protein NQ314_020699 [Rhamnusium bicolor]|uniref:PX domain-containing protein n=1 Tax=Rhamnusium bicolor TaxID=1586634 RepID=A0AAV8WKK5_9CUCU|nr:hypothetical protein NQ314_020699 [Rhamnusium bicolor]